MLDPENVSDEVFDSECDRFRDLVEEISKEKNSAVTMEDMMKCVNATEKILYGRPNSASS